MKHINACLLLLLILLNTFHVLVVLGGGENKEGVVSKMRMQREKGDELGCGNIADAHVKHGGEGEKGISGSDCQTSRRGQKATGDMLNSLSPLYILYHCLSPITWQ